MSAERLREAARVLRERAEAADTPGPWQEIEDDWSTTDVPAYTVHGSDGLSDDVTGGCLPLGDAAYIATMHPGVGLALADWLDATTCGLHCGADGMRFPYCSACEDSTYDHECPKRELCKHTGPMRRALAIADLILGDAP